MALADNIRLARERLGLSLADAAAKMVPPVPYQYWQQWEGGKEPLAGTLYRIADALGVGADELRPVKRRKSGTVRAKNWGP